MRVRVRMRVSVRVRVGVKRSRNTHLWLPTAWLAFNANGSRCDVERAEALAVIRFATGDPDTLCTLLVVRILQPGAEVGTYLVVAQPVVRQPAAVDGVDALTTLEPPPQPCVPPFDLGQAHLNRLRLGVALAPQRYAVVASIVAKPPFVSLEAVGTSPP